ncbi:hypothetical protein ABT009_28135 [Streptomyces sp. NPDC002896]|uniref:hypothetical protein n=1 Tax=Streptomyces sp. NPDC002896 TaxID=3154438 RepID=UPI0033319075
MVNGGRRRPTRKQLADWAVAWGVTTIMVWGVSHVIDDEPANVIEAGVFAAIAITLGTWGEHHRKRRANRRAEKRSART